MNFKRIPFTLAAALALALAGCNKNEPSTPVADGANKPANSTAAEAAKAEAAKAEAAKAEATKAEAAKDEAVKAEAIKAEAAKAEAVKAALQGPVTVDCPASLLRKQAHCLLFLDSESASLL